MPARTPDDLHQLFLTRINAGDAEAVAALYEEDAILAADPQKVVRGRAAILDGLKNFLAIRPRMVLNAGRVLRNGSVAILYSDWTISATKPDGSLLSVDVRPTVVAREQPDGTWLVVIDDPSVGETATG